MSDYIPREIPNDTAEFLRTILLPITQAEKTLNIEGFFGSLVSESDWGFVVKLHALFESLFAHLITDVMGRPELLPIFSNIPMSDTRFGKIKFLETMGLITSEDSRFIRNLSELRNDLVHDVTNASFSLQNHVAMLAKDKKKSFVESIHGKERMKEPNIDGTKFDAYTFTESQAKQALASGAFAVLVQVSMARRAFVKNKPKQ